MFLIAITKNKLGIFFPGIVLNEIISGSAIITVITDNSTSKFIPESGGFSVVEAPLLNRQNDRFDLFSKSTFRTNTLTIFKSTHCPRTIYFHHNANNEFFCATHIGLLRKAGIKIDENQDMLPEFFTYRYIMPPNTLFKRIKQLSNGSRLRVECPHGQCHLQRLEEYQPPAPEKKVDSFDAEIGQLVRYLSQSLKGFHNYQDSVGAILSGGIDSSITFQACKKYLGVQHSYSTEYPFEDPQLNTERQYALSAAKALGTEHHLFESTVHDYLYGLLDCITLTEEPVHHLQSVPIYLLFKNGIPAERSIIVQGLGAGGIVGNFRNFLYWREKSAAQIFQFKPTRDLLSFLSRVTGKAKHFTNCMNKVHLEYPLSNPRNLIWDWHAYGNKQWVCKEFGVMQEDIIKHRYEIYKTRKTTIYDLWSLYSLLGDEAITLGLWGKIAEANQKILFSPWYEQTFLDYAFSLPWSFKLSKPENKIRKGMGRYLGIPEFILNRRKSGFGLLQKGWAQKDGALEPLVPLAGRVWPISQIREVQDSNPQNQMIFWNMINYALWKRLIIDQEPIENLKSELNTAIKNQHG